MSKCKLEVLIFIFCHFNYMNCLCMIKSGDITETLIPVIHDSVTVILIIYINSELIHLSQGSFNTIKVVLMKEESDLIIRGKSSYIVPSFICRKAYSNVSFHLCIDFIVKSQPFNLLNI